MFKPKRIYYEEDITNYQLGKELLSKYETVPKTIIGSHNNILELRSKQNSEFLNLKQNLIIGVRKTHKYTDNHKVSDYLVPYTSSGCSAMCMYCYLVCNYNKCSYMRLFVNREQMLDKLINFSKKSDKDLTFEIGSNSDLILENEITNNLVWTIENFASSKKGFLTFPTKFDMVNPILNLKGIDRVIPRVSVNPSEIIKHVEYGTSSLDNRINAINKLKAAGYNVGILIAPIILVDGYEKMYEDLIITLSEKLSKEAKKDVFFEMIFMTYSYVHNAINKEAFLNTKYEIYNKDIMTGRGKGKYSYKMPIKENAKRYMLDLIKKYFPDNKIIYIV